MKNRRVLITGGAGVIGTELRKLLTEKGAYILSVDRNLPPEENVYNNRNLQKDIAVDELQELLDFQPEIIFHLAAAFERSKESPQFWRNNWLDNIFVSHRIAEIIKEMTQLKVFVFASSYLIYSPSLYLSPSADSRIVYLKEGDNADPRNLVGAAKYYAEKELEFIRKLYNLSLRLVHARIFRVYGHRSKDVISRWVRDGISGEDIMVYNEENRFDFIFAEDVAVGLMKLAESERAAGPVNLGRGASCSIGQVLKTIEKGIPLNIKTKRIQQEDYEASAADLTKLKELTGWMPMIDIEKGIDNIIDFELKED